VQAGLYDPEAEDAPNRLAVLEHLLGKGATLEELITAEGSGGLPALAGEIQRRSRSTRLTPQELADAAGVSRDMLARITRAAGLPGFDVDARVFRAEDVEAFRIFAMGADMLGDETTLEFTRAMGVAIASIADAAMAVFGTSIAGPLRSREAPELEQAKVVEAASELLVGSVPTAIETLFFHHVEAAIAREIAGGGSQLEARAAHLAVGFLDLVGSTPMMRRLEPDELSATITAFERRATELVAAREGRVVKTIGDEVMFVMPNTAAACEVAIELRDFIDGHEVLTRIRGGLAVGPLVRGYGDFYGTEVTQAARLVRVAEPGTLLVTEAVRDRAFDAAGLRFTPAGTRRVPGFDDEITVLELDRG
jgi:adenylate cyclase